jgi:hypothetical protein
VIPITSQLHPLQNNLDVALSFPQNKIVIETQHMPVPDFFSVTQYFQARQHSVTQKVLKRCEIAYDHAAGALIITSQWDSLLKALSAIGVIPVADLKIIIRLGAAKQKQTN